MANKDAPFGGTPIRHRNGAAYNGATRTYYIPSNGSALFVGDPVVKTGTSNAAAFEGHGIATLPTVAKATAGNNNPITGFIVSFGGGTADRTITHNPASTENVVHVADDPDLIFLMQDNAGGTLNQDDVGGSANLIFTESGSTSTGQSGVEFDSGTIGTSSTDQVTIQRLHDLEGNTVANFGLWELKINKHTEAHGAAAI